MSETPKKLSERVKDALSRLGQTQAELARATNKSKPTIARLLAGAYDGACPLDLYLPVKQALGLRGEEPAAALHVKPLEAKPRAERRPRAPKANAYNEAALFGRLAALEEAQAKRHAQIMTILGSILLAKDPKAAPGDWPVVSHEGAADGFRKDT